MLLEPVTLQGWADEVQGLAEHVGIKLRRAHELDDREVGDILRELLSAVGKAQMYLRTLARDRREDARERGAGPEVA